MSEEQKKLIVKLAVTAALMIFLKFVSLPLYLTLILYAFTYLYIGFDILKEAAEGIASKHPFDENFLMAFATVGAIALAVYEKSYDFGEAVAVMLFYRIGEFFEDYAVAKSRKNIADLMNIRPDYANIEVDGQLKKVSPEEVETGSVITVLPGERIPIDGTVTFGSSIIDTSALTGESLPKEISAGDKVQSGCINLNGVIKIKTEKIFSESTVSRILALVESEDMKKSDSEQFIRKFAKIYTPCVVLCAVLLAVFPPLIRIVFSFGAAEWSVWIYRALSFLVISCPCALVISIPLSFFAGIGNAGRNGILIKGSQSIESLAKVKTAVFDKTGTLTEGSFEVSAIHHSKIPDEKLLEYAALAESFSNHPISQSLRKAYKGKLDRSRVEKVKEITGKGVTALVDGREIAAGDGKLMESLGLEYMECHCFGTIIHIAVDGEYYGHIVISDVVKPTAEKALKKLKKCGIKKIVMLTGDNEKSAKETADSLGIDEYRFGLLPEDKTTAVKSIEKSGMLAFVGDGINDAPVLMCADVGIAMGEIGSDAAVEAADVVLMDDEPLKIASAIKISKKCMSIVYENICLTMAVKIICLILGAFGITNMWMAVFADVGIMILAVLNSVRALCQRI